MWRCFVLIVALTMFPAIPHGAAAHGAGRSAGHNQPDVSWLFDTRTDSNGNPNTRVFLIVGRRRVFILRDVGQFHVLERQDYSGRDVPAAAIAACTGWWAGSGEELYVIRRRRQLIVYIRYLDEQTELGRYRRLKVIPL